MGKSYIFLPIPAAPPKKKMRKVMVRGVIYKKAFYQKFLKKERREFYNRGEFFIKKRVV